MWVYKRVCVCVSAVNDKTDIISSVLRSCFLLFDWLDQLFFIAKQDCAWYIETQFYFNEAEAHNCFKKHMRFLAMLRQSIMKIKGVLRNKDGFGLVGMD